MNRRLDDSLPRGCESVIKFFHDKTLMYCKTALNTKVVYNKILWTSCIFLCIYSLGFLVRLNLQLKVFQLHSSFHINRFGNPIFVHYFFSVRTLSLSLYFETFTYLKKLKMCIYL